jgi:cell wall-associated NlpC family hydrolase
MVVVGLGLIAITAPTPGHDAAISWGTTAGSGSAPEADMVSLVTPLHVAVALVETPAVLPSRAAVALTTALAQLGRPYRYGAAGPRSFDCSGLTLFAYRAAGINLPHSAAAQYHSGPRIARNDLQPGDLIFWAGLGHVGIYIGGGRMVHAPRPGQAVSIISIDAGRFVGAVRPG